MPLQATGTFNGYGDVDYFAATLVGGQSYQFNLTSGLGYVFWLSDPALASQIIQAGYSSEAALYSFGYRLGSGGPGFGVEPGHFTPGSSGTYYFATYAAAPGAYGFSVVPVLDDIQDNVASTATFSGDVASGRHESSNDKDYFRAALLGGHTYAYATTGDAQAEQDVLVVDAAGNVVQGDENDDGGAGSFTPASDGTYFFVVAASSNPASFVAGNYTLTVSGLVTGGIVYPDDLPAGTSGTIALSTTPASGTWERPQDVDSFAVNLTAGLTYRMTFAASDPEGDGSITLVDGNGAVVAFDEYNATLDFAVAATGTYFARVTSDNTVGAYSIGVQPIADDFSNNGAGSTPPIGSTAVGATRTAAWSGNGDVDLFSISLTGGVSYRISQTAFPANYAGAFVFLRADGQLLSTITPATTGVYVIAAAGENHGANTGAPGTYGFTVTSYTDDHGDQMANATAVTIQASGTTTVNGAFNVVDDVDVFRVALNAGQAYAIAITDTSGSQGGEFPGVQLFDASGIAVGLTPEPQATAGGTFFTPATTGTYYIAASAFGQPGTYRLTVAPSLDDYPASTATTGVVRESVAGTAGPDTLRGTLGADALSGGGGNDILYVSQGADTIDGGANTDRLFVQLSDRALFGAPAGALAYAINASSTAGSGTFTSSDGRVNTSFSAIEAVTVDLSNNGNTATTLTTGATFNRALTVRTGSGDDAVSGGAAADLLYASRGADTLNGGGGTDRAYFYFSTPVFDAATAARTYTFSNSSARSSDGALDTSLSSIEGLSIFAAGFNFGDTVDTRGFSGSGFLNIYTGNGNDTILTGSTDDNIDAGMGVNLVDSGAGTDRVTVGYDTSSGVTLTVLGATNSISTYLDTQLVNTVINAEDVALGQIGDIAQGQRIDASGYSGPIRLIFLDSNRNDVFLGTAAADIFASTSGLGASGGVDAYTGNGGADTFDFTYAGYGLDNTTITDFEADDTIDLSYNGAAFLSNTPEVSRWIGSAQFSGRAGEFRSYAAAGRTYLQIDGNGDGTADGTLVLANGTYALIHTADPDDDGIHLVRRGAAITEIVVPAGGTGSGTAGNDSVTLSDAGGTADLSSGGDDTATGGAASDNFYFGAAFTAADSVDGGGGTMNQIGLSGDYAAGLVLGAGTINHIQTIQMAPGNSYAITTNDGNVKPGEALTFYAGELRPGNGFTLNAGAETDGTITVFAGQGADTITTGAANDGIYFGPDGRFDPATDRVDAGGGTGDQLALDGAYTLVLGSSSVTNVEVLALLDSSSAQPASYSITLLNSLSAPGSTFGVWGVPVLAPMAISAAGVDFSLRAFGGYRADAITGGNAADWIYGGQGADTLIGGAGADVFFYDEAVQSSGATFDTLDFSLAQGDRIDLPSAVTALDPTVTSGTLTRADFDAELAAAIGAVLGDHHAIVFTPTAGDFNGSAFVVVDIDGGGYQAGVDYVMRLASGAMLDMTAFI